MNTATRRTFLQAGIATTALPLAAHASAEPSATRDTVRFKPGLISYNVAAKWDLATILKVCKSVGLAAVELRTTHKHGVEPSLSADARRAVRKQFSDSGVVFWGCGSTCEFHSPDAAVVTKQIETCKEFVQLVADLGGRGVKVRPNALPKGVEPARTLEQIGKSLVECGKAAANAGVEIWVEVHGPETQNPENMRTIMQACGHPAVGICWNSNATDLKEKSVKAAFEMLKPWLKSCHVNNLWKEGAGLYPYRELFTLLREHGYDRYTLCEDSWTAPDVASGEQVLRYFVGLWKELTRI